MVFLHQKAVVIVLLSACLYRKASMCIHCLLCYIRVCAFICNYTSGSVESLSLETVGREVFFKIFYWIFSFTSSDIFSAFKNLWFVYRTKVIHGIIIIFLCTSSWSWDSIVIVATRLQTGQSRIGIPAGARDFPFSEVSRLSLASTLPHIHWVLGFFLRGEAAGAWSSLFTSVWYEG